MNRSTAGTSKTQRINLRASERQEALLRQAAEASDITMSEFILGTAVAQAEHVLADRRWFFASEELYIEFERLLDAPLPTTEKLHALLAEESVFGKPLQARG